MIAQIETSVIPITALNRHERDHCATVPGTPHRNANMEAFLMRNLFLATVAVVFVAVASIAMLMASSDDEMEPLTLAGVQEVVYGS